MTAEEREAAVEALRCAADLNHTGRGGTYMDMMAVAGYSESTQDPAFEALVDAMHEGRVNTWTDAALEAAALLEDGWNPGDPVYRLEDRGTGDPVERRG